MKAPKASNSPAFRKKVRRLQQKVEKETLKLLPKLGRQSPRAWDGVWSMIDALYGYSTCADGCPGADRDHSLRYLAGRATNFGLGALHNAASGWYDNALLACRALGEQANLATLLTHSDAALAIYKSGDKRQRLQTLAPRRVYEALANLDAAVVFSVERWELLSARLVHPSFDEIVLTHTPGALVVGPMWQPGGFILCLNEIGIALGGYVTLRRDPDITDAEAAALTDGTARIRDGLGSLLIDDIPPGFEHPLPEHRWLAVNESVD